jgi:pyruvate dehydrogenase E2 component (dihydrolipoamide acetyltransferase)
MNFLFKFPDIGEGVHEGKVIQWKTKVGDSVRVGDILAIVETDKVVAEMPSPKEGKLFKQMVAEGQIIRVGEVLAEIETAGEPQAEVVEEASTVMGKLETAKGIVLPPSGEGILDKSAETISLVERKEVALATPVARKMAKDLGIDLAKIKGSGPGGRVMKEDILKSAQRASEATLALPAAPKTAQPPLVVPTPLAPTRAATTVELDVKVSPLSTLRGTIANNMEVSQHIPTATVSDYGEIDEMVAMRERLKAKGEHLTFTPILVKILAAALKKYPLLNSHYDATRKEIRSFTALNIGFAVDTDAGLMVPTIRNVEKKSIAELQEEIKSLSEKAAKRTIPLDDLRHGTISITNYGPFGGVFGSPMIVPPQVAILGIGRIHKSPFVKQDQVVAAHILPVSLVFDHRVVDGAYAGSFVSYFLQLAGSPDKILISM